MRWERRSRQEQGTLALPSFDKAGELFAPGFCPHEECISRGIPLLALDLHAYGAALEVAQAYVKAEADASVEPTLMTSQIRSKSQYTALKVLKVFRQDGIDFLHGQSAIPAGRDGQVLALLHRHPDVGLIDDMAHAYRPEQGRAAVGFDPHALVVLDHLDGPVGCLHFPNARPPKWKAMMLANSVAVSASHSMSARVAKSTPRVQPYQNRPASMNTSRKKKP